MTQYDNTNRGAIWPNEKKEKDTHPDFTGSLNVEGKEYWVSAWRKSAGAKSGSPVMSFSIKPKDEAKKPQRDAAEAFGDDPIDKDDLGF